MNLHENNLKKIVECISKYGVIKDILILNNSIIVRPLSIDKPSKLIEIDLNRAKDFQINFTLGDEKKEINHKK